MYNAVTTRSNMNQTISFYHSNSYRKQSHQYVLLPETWMLGGIALIVLVVVLFLFILRCAVYCIPRCFGYEATSRIEGPGHSLGMYSLDLQTQTKNQGYANVGYIHRESVTNA